MAIRNRIFQFFSILVLYAAQGCQQGANFTEADTDYDKELAKIESNITESKSQVSDSESAIRYVHRLYQKASLTGDFEQFRKVETELDAVEKKFGESSTLTILRADLNFKLHRLDTTEQLNKRIEQMGFKRQAKVLQADLAMQRGRYLEAITKYRSSVNEDSSWPNLARMAYYYGNTGQAVKASEIYAQAQEQLSAKDIRNFAWLELQQGLLELQQQHYQQALNHYLVAEQAYSGYWLISEHIAEAYGLMGRTDEAIGLYEKIIAKTNNPEFIAALATLLRKTDPVKAAELDKKADELFNRNYALYPEAALGHFITYLLDREPLDERLLPFALRNHQLRPNAEAKMLLIKAYLKTGDIAGAKNYTAQLLDTPWRNPKIDALVAEVKSRN